MLVKRAYGVMKFFVPRGGQEQLNLHLQTIGIKVVRIFGTLKSCGCHRWKF